MKNMKTLLDTSFLVSAFEKKIDIISELMKFGKPEVYTLDLVVRELESFSKSRDRKGVNSRLSLAFIEMVHMKVIQTSGGHTDSLIISYARNRKMTVCTLDSKLKKELTRKGVAVITIRQGKYLIRVPMPPRRHRS